ncbi:MAG: alpha/beta hydrolase [Ktedonobacterales bacterium]|nr:alpha/beta hydrolase [Ktedonobacterales bacterium]
MTNEPSIPESSAAAAPPEAPRQQITERSIVSQGQRVASAMNDAPRAFLARAPLVVLPATGYTWRDYLPVIEHFAATRRVFALDWPGFGGSAKPDPDSFTYDAVSFTEVLAGWMDALGIGRAVLLGNGLGGTVALRYAAAHPKRVLGLALVAPRGLGAPGPMRHAVMSIFSAPVLFSLLDPLLLWLALGPATPGARTIIARRRAMRRSPDYAAYEAAFTALARHETRSLADLPALARAVTAPTLVLRGGLDPLFTAGDAHRAAARIGERGALEVMLPGAGHLPFLQEPQRFFQAVEGLLNAAEMAALADAEHTGQS